MEAQIVYSILGAIVAVYLIYVGFKNIKRLKDPKAQPGYKTQIKK